MDEKKPDKVIPFSQPKVSCEGCGMFQLCLPIGVDLEEFKELDGIIQRHRILRRGEYLYRAGETFHSIYAVGAGSIKSFTSLEDGCEQVTGFHLPGEMLGLEAINEAHHPCSAKALETTNLCEIPFERLGELSQRIPVLQTELLKVMSKEILHDQSLLVLLGKKSADERLAAFLVSISTRYKQRGFSAESFRLGMSRNDIASYLGLAVETVSRLFTRFHEENLLQVHGKDITICDEVRLHAMAQNAKEYSGHNARVQ